MVLHLPITTTILTPMMIIIQVGVSGIVDETVGGVEIDPRPEPGKGSPTKMTGGGRSVPVVDPIGTVGIVGSIGIIVTIAIGESMDPESPSISPPKLPKESKYQVPAISQDGTTLHSSATALPMSSAESLTLGSMSWERSLRVSGWFCWFPAEAALDEM